MVLLGYMGSGKSYALGVLIENALLKADGITRNDRPLSVVAFNYRRNPDARFEYGSFLEPNDTFEDVGRLRHWYGAKPASVEQVNVFAFKPELHRRQKEYHNMKKRPILFRSDELRVDHWMILMKPPTASSEYMEIIRDIIQNLFYEDRLTFKNLEQHIFTDERLSPAQRRRAQNRLSFAQKWISDDRDYEWQDVLQPGAMNVMDLRAQAMSQEDALRICLVVTDLVRRTKNGVNKMIVFDEAHEYLESKHLVPELENAITQIRHDGLSFILASQYPDRIPDRLFKYLSTRVIFKLQDSSAIEYIRRAAPNLAALSPQAIANLELEAGRCFIQSDDEVSHRILRTPQPLKIRPRCSKHGGKTLLHAGTSSPSVTGT
ncbi:MAG: ATP-binding protein, partial [Myxococcota bacterium]